MRGRDGLGWGSPQSPRYFSGREAPSLLYVGRERRKLKFETRSGECLYRTQTINSCDRNSGDWWCLVVPGSGGGGQISKRVCSELRAGLWSLETSLTTCSTVVLHCSAAVCLFVSLSNCLSERERDCNIYIVAKYWISKAADHLLWLAGQAGPLQSSSF